MAFGNCRICKEKFDLTKVLTNTVSEGFSAVSTLCGHLFHLKCLEGALTNQKLLHARHGTGPLRRFCPVPRCNADIPSEDSIIKLSFSDDANNLDGDANLIDTQDTEGKLVKRVQSLMGERERLAESLEKTEAEAAVYRSALDRIKFDLCTQFKNKNRQKADIQSFLKDDYQMKKGDFIFWITRDGTYAPGKILEIRKKPGENVHYAIVKLDNKTKVSGVGPHSVNRDTLILPITELITFKSFFGEFFDKFQANFESLRMDLNSDIQEISSPTGSQSSADRQAAYYKSTRKISRSVSKSSIGIPLSTLDELNSESVESVAVPLARKNSADAKPSSKIIRSKTIHYGAGNEPRRLEKCRSMSWTTPPSATVLDSPNSETSRVSESFLDDGSSSLEGSYNEVDDGANEFIREGERVIWFDTYSEFQQLGTVAAVFVYSPCAIVKFDEHPVVKHKFQYRTVQLDELFPYDLASPEDKFRIAESYGKVGDFVENREHLFSISNEESTSECDEPSENVNKYDYHES